MRTFLNSWLGKNWWSLLVSINLFILAFTVANPHISNFQQKWRFITPFSLHTENNFAAWWSGITMLLAALLAYQRSLNADNKNMLAWKVLAIVLAGLSLDEIGSFHERIGHLKGWTGILPYGVLLLCLFAYANIRLFQSEKTTTNAKYLCIAIALFSSVALQEYLEHNYAWKPWMLGLRVGIEEGTELLATLFTLLAVIYNKNEKLNSLSLLPQHKTVANLKWIAAIGLIAHIIGSYLIIKIGDPFFRGNPMNWYPTSIYFCIALICFYKMINTNNQSERKKWGLVTVLSLTISIGIMTNLFMIILPGINNFIALEIINEHFILVYLISLPIFALLLTNKIPIAFIVVLSSFVSIFVLIWIDLSIDNTWLRYSLLGIFSYCTFYIFTSKRLLATEDLARQSPSINRVASNTQ